MSYADGKIPSVKLLNLVVMIVNFRIREISRDTHKLTQTTKLIIIIIIIKGAFV